MLRVAAAMLAFLPVHHAAPASLDAYPQVFSPRASALIVSAKLRAPGRVGLRLATLRGHELGWLLRPRLRRGVAYSWHGRLQRRPVRDGFYLLQLVAGKRVLARATFRLDATLPGLTGFRATNGGRPFAGDGPMLTTLSPYDDGRRDEARIVFTLSETSTVALLVERTDRTRRVVAADTVKLGPGRHTLTWAPAPTTAPRTYLLELTATDTAGNSHTYGAESAYVDRFPAAPVVRVLGIDAAFTEPSYAPGETASLRVATDAPSFTMQFFRVGGEPKPSYLVDEMSGLEVTEPQTISWASHADAPATIRVRVGDWPSGVYYARLEAPDGRVGYVPFVVRPGVLGAKSRTLVVLPTNTWQAYNFFDRNGDGWGDTWYAGRDDLRVPLDRPYVNRGVPPRFTRYEEPFLNWMVRAKVSADFLSEHDLVGIRSGRELSAGYDLIVYPGHTEYVTMHEYDLIEQYRDAGGNLIFLSANNFFRRVVERNGVLTRLRPWRDLGRPEAALLGAQYRANDEGQRQGSFVVRDTADVPWLWQELGFSTGSTFGEVVGGYGIEIDSTTPDSPPGTIVLAEIPDVLGPGLTAQMTYYETPAGAKVFDAGALDFVGSTLTFPITHLLLNLWKHLTVP